jgi:hypothetical protein
MPPTIDRSRHNALVAEGREAVLSGDKGRAQALLKAALRLDPHSEEAWMWLSGALTAPDEMAACLQRVLEINPHNEQALDGLRWLATEHGMSLTQRPQPTESPAQPTPIAEPVRLHAPPGTSGSLLLEAALYPVAAGVWLGLLRLVGWLRPSTLWLLRGNQGGLGWTGSFGVVVAAVALYALAMLVLWLVLGWQFSRVRVAGRADLFDSLVRVGHLWRPGYLWLVALLTAWIGLDLSQGPWRVIVVLCWVLLLLGAALIGRGLWRLLDTAAVPNHKRVGIAGRLVVIIVLGGLLGLGLAGIGTAALLR